jgi:outer membrane protein assembly factor BamB
MRVPTLTLVLVASVVWSQGRGNPTAWPTAYGDAQHSSWVRSDVNISPESMGQPGFALQWKTTLESPVRQGVSLSQGIVTSGVNLFTPLSTMAGPSNVVFAVDNDTGNVFWTRRFEGALPVGTAECPGGITGAPTRMVSLVAGGGTARGGAGRGGRAYSGAVGEPGAGVPIPPPGGRGAGRRGAAPPPGGAGDPQPQNPTAGAGRGAPTPPPPPQPTPFPTNAAAVAAAGGGGGGLFRSSGVVYTVSPDGMLRTLGLVSGKDVERPAPFLPANARFSDLIAVGEIVYAATSHGCGGAARGIWAMNAAADPKTVVSWKTNGGDPLGSVVFARTGMAIAAVAAGGSGSAVVALDPRTLQANDSFSRPGIELASAPIVFEEGGRDIVAVTTKDGRIVLLDAASLGGANHATPLFVSEPLVTGRATFAAQSPSVWQERASPAVSSPPADVAASGGTRSLLLPVTGPLAAAPGVVANGSISTGAILSVRISHENGRFAVQPGWASENIAGPLTPIVVNGVVFAVSGAANGAARLYALNGTTGTTLWHSANAMTSPVSGRSFWIGSGHVFVGTIDGTVHAFGFDMERGSPAQRAGWR